MVMSQQPGGGLFFRYIRPGRMCSRRNALCRSDPLAGSAQAMFQQPFNGQTLLSSRQLVQALRAPQASDRGEPPAEPLRPTPRTPARCRVRWVALITAALVALGWLLAVVDMAGSGAAPDVAQGETSMNLWRRTANGWENAAAWQPPSPVRSPPFHPGLLAALQAWTAMAAVLTAPPRTPRPARRR